MSMMRLLSAGRSLVDTKTLTPNYRMRGKFHLPKFGGPKNPFVQPGKNKPAPVMTQEKVAQSKIAEAPMRTVVAEVASVEKTSAEPLKKTQRMPLPAEQLKETKKIPFVAARNNLGAPASSQPLATEKRAGKMPALLGLWRKVWSVAGRGFKKLNAFAWAMDHKPKQKSSIPRFDKPAQGELSLDNIRVVRNDLCESDLEIAPAKTFSAQTNFKPALQPMSENKKAEPAKVEEQPLFSHTCST